MKNKKVFFFVLLISFGLSSISYICLEQRPVRFFVLKAEANRAQAFQIEVYLNRRLSTLVSLPLNRLQELKAVQILSSKNIFKLESLATSLGSFDFVLGTSQSDPDMNVFWNDFLTGQPLADSFSNLNKTDKLYFELVAKQELTAQISEETSPNAVITLPIVTITPTMMAQAKMETAKPIVRVEILNGCGIKGAADWVVSRVAGPTIKAKNGGNAVNFNYVDSQLLYSVTASPDLIKTLIALGFLKLSQISSKILPAGYDAVLIVGKDFRSIKGN
jgi:hypothetical protein